MALRSRSSASRRTRSRSLTIASSSAVMARVPCAGRAPLGASAPAAALAAGPEAGWAESAGAGGAAAVVEDSASGWAAVGSPALCPQWSVTANAARRAKCWRTVGSVSIGAASLGAGAGSCARPAVLRTAPAAGRALIASGSLSTHGLVSSCSCSRANASTLSSCGSEKSSACTSDSDSAVRRTSPRSCTQHPRSTAWSHAREPSAGIRPKRAHQRWLRSDGPPLAEAHQCSHAQRAAASLDVLTVTLKAQWWVRRAVVQRASRQRARGYLEARQHGVGDVRQVNENGNELGNHLQLLLAQLQRAAALRRREQRLCGRGAQSPPNSARPVW
jgi:hypothetical protein